MKIVPAIELEGKCAKVCLRYASKNEKKEEHPSGFHIYDESWAKESAGPKKTQKRQSGDLQKGQKLKT